MFFKFNNSDVLKNTIRCYPDVEFLLSSGTTIFNKRISEGLNINSSSYNRKDVNVDRSTSQKVNPFIYRDQYYDAIDGSSVFSSSIGSIITGTYIDNKTYRRYYVTSSAQPEYVTINRLLQGYKKHISGDLDPNFTGNRFELNTPFTALMFDRDIYGSRIKEGSIQLKTYLADGSEAESYYQMNDVGGLIYNEGPSTENIGYALYHYGMIILHNGPQDENVIFGNFDYSPTLKFSINFKGTYDIQNLTMFCNVNKNLNLSNNPTYILKDQLLFQTQSSIDSFKENERLLIKNLNENKYLQKNIDFINDSYNTVIDSDEYNNMIINTSSLGDNEFKKGVFINSINIYDKDKNLIAIANLANPLKKTEEKSYIVKLQIDL